MNSRFLILAVSLVANAALGFFYVRHPVDGSSHIEKSRSAATVPDTALHSAPDAVETGIPLNEQTWMRLNATDDGALVSQLRAAGFPPDMILALVNLRLNTRYADLFKRLRSPIDYPYWRKNHIQSDPSTLETRAARRALEREIADERRKLLGANSELLTPVERIRRERLYGEIPQAKTEQLEAITRDYDDLASLVRERSKGIILPEDREQLALLEREKRADLVTIFTPAELVEYDLRASPSALTVRNRLRYFDSSEEEYRTFVALQLDFDRTYGAPNLLNAEQKQLRSDAEKNLAAQIKASLSPERFAQYEIKTDQSYPSISDLLTRYKVTGTSADALVGTQRDLAQRYNAIRQDRSVNPVLREAQIKLLADEATTRLTTALGNETFNEYKRNGGPLNSLLNRSNSKP